MGQGPNSTVLFSLPLVQFHSRLRQLAVIIATVAVGSDIPTGNIQRDFFCESSPSIVLSGVLWPADHVKLV